MTPTNTFIISVWILTFFSISALYTRLTYPPTYNYRFGKILSNQMAKTSINKNDIYKQYMQMRNIVKANLFIQTMIKNQFGYHCGQIFFITKFQVVKLFMMNIPLIVLFYKKICLAK
ncbi:hypothetical protein DERP_001868 [Dermatophagoides pteronyssinus]|uniref:Uncharacterized protein n=1 Tax=Dermatophagoides pteronyssinus TaxID=6956 RepID=A0ABQ8JBR7_DERPT|nr:hypothetical protein DERP_001868 [Dermatophagoides pteronyssinus]